MRLLGLLFIALLLSSCSSPEKKLEVAPRADDAEIIEEQITSAPTQAAEQLYIYGQLQPKDPREIILKLNAEPLLLVAGYTRLVGVVSGREPVALLEIAGAGLGVRCGDEVAGYRVIEVLPDRLKLRKEQGDEEQE